MIRNEKKTIELVALGVFFLLIVGYALFGSRNIILGVKIKNVNITDGLKVSSPILEIKGNAKNATFISLNGRIITVDQAGNFDETIALLSGYNTVDIKARDKFGYSDEKNYKLIYSQ